MAKAKSVYFCTDCGGESVRWMGKCPHCGSWNTLVEQIIRPEAEKKPGRISTDASRAKACAISKVQAGDTDVRMQSGMEELDTVLGGGLVPGSSVLLGGEPGIGKSTLLLQAAHRFTKYGKVLYISGEESAAQIAQRAHRLQAVDDEVYLLAQTDITAALTEARQYAPALVILDSVQALFVPGVEAAPGSVSQVRAVAAEALSFARESGAAILLVGHVTKEGMLAGPRVLEHMVDAVLYFEGERYSALRLLRAVKNRFGSTNEVGVFSMEETGLHPVASPSAYFLSERQSHRPGSAVTCVMQGSRPMLLEVQALVTPSSFSNARRLAQGFDYNRTLMILAVLERRLGLQLGNKDVYLNAAGGVKVDDPAADLAIAAAVVSSLLDRPIGDEAVIVGELGLLGELRRVSQMPRRQREAAAYGFSLLLAPTGSEEAESRLRQLTAQDLPQAAAILGLGK